MSSKIGTTTNLGKFLEEWTLQENSDGGAAINLVATSHTQLTKAETSVTKVYTAFGITPSPTFNSNTTFQPIPAFTTPPLGAGGLEEQYYFHPDHLGSSNYITNIAGDVSQHMEYFAFGETFVEEHKNSINSPYKFNGKELDEESGLYYYGARYYDPRLSIWASVDPLAEDYPSISGYIYCANNPINIIDPDGRKIIFAKGSSKEFKVAFRKAIQYLNKHKMGAIFAKLESRKEVFTITEGVADDKYSSAKKTITWDPSRGLVTTNGTIISATTCLQHEGNHGLQSVENPKKYIDDCTTKLENYDDQEEKRVIEGSEQATAKALGEIKEGEVTRKDHRGYYIETVDPTSTTGKDEIIIKVPKIKKFKIFKPIQF